MANQTDPEPKTEQQKDKEEQTEDDVDITRCSQLASRITSFLQSESCMRLNASIGPLEEELETWHNPTQDKDSVEGKWYQNAKNDINKAKKARDTQLAWKFLFRAVCATAYLLKGEDLRNVANVTLLESEEKLDGWRKKAVKSALCDENGNLKTVEKKKSSPDERSDHADNNSTLRNHDVYLALEILTEHHNNRYIKIDIAHKQLVLLIISSVVLIPLGVLALATSPAKFDITNLYFLAAVVIFGAIGGTISGLVTISRVSTKRKIPDQILSSWSTMSKPIYGAISALGVSVFTFAGLVVGGASADANSIYLVLAISVLAGFSERFLLNVLRENDIQQNQKEIVDKLDEVTSKLKTIASPKNEENNDNKNKSKTS
jgi:hypothetical protein